MSVSNNKLISNSSYNVTKYVDPRFLQASFEKGLYKILEIDHILKHIEDPELARDFTVFAMHYLVKGAKIPILNSDKKANLLFLEFFSDSNPKYFRSQGGSIISLYMKLLATGSYKFLFESDGKVKDSIQAIKNEQFRNYLKFHYNYQTVSSKKSEQSKLEDRLHFVSEFKPQAYNKRKTFLDVSSLLSDSYHVAVEPKDLEAKIKKLKEVIRANPHDLSNVMIGAFIKLTDGQEICILFQDHKLKIQNADIAKLALAEEEEIKDHKAHSGYFPDIIGVRRSILMHDFNIKDLLSLAPVQIEEKSKSKFPQERTAKVVKKFKRLISALQKSKMQDQSVVKVYFKLFANFLNTLQASFEKDLAKKEKAPLVMGALRNIHHILIHMEKSNLNYEEFLSQTDLICEEFVYLLTALKPFEVTFEEILNSQGIKFESENAEKSSYAFTSGMNSFAQVLGALRKIPSQEKLKVGYATTNYFELRINVFPHLTGHFQVDQDPTDVFQKVDKDYDVFFMDIYPNEVTLPSVSRVNVEGIIDSLLQKRQGKPLTVVMDTSASLFCGEDVQSLIDTYQKEIDQGQLNLVIVNSLAKFSMCGLDKYTGGVVQTYNNKKIFSEFNNHLVKKQSKERLSPEAERFFSLFFSSSRDNIHDYLDRVNKNTQVFYDSLTHKLQNKHTAMSMAERKSDKIPMISFQFDEVIKRLGITDTDKANQIKENSAILLHYYIYALAKLENLPMDIRTSFGFAHANINDCWIALRLTLGLEDPKMLERYKEIFLKANAELENTLKKDGSLFLKMVEPSEGFYMEKFKDIKSRREVLQSVSSKNDGLSHFLNAVDLAYHPQLSFKEKMKVSFGNIYNQIRNFRMPEMGSFKLTPLVG